VTDCTGTKKTTWIEDQFTVTSSGGIRNRKKRVADIVVRELKRAKPGVWGCIQAREVRSLQLDVVAHGGRRTRGAAVRNPQGVRYSTFVLSMENDNDFRSRCE
jgi:hypothetical protein